MTEPCCPRGHPQTNHYQPPIYDVRLKETDIDDVVTEYIDDVTTIPTEEAKAFFALWNLRIPPKLAHQFICAGIHYALKHPDRITIVAEPPATPDTTGASPEPE